MKLGGTLKVEIIKPLSEAGARMRALTDTLGPALNLVLRDLHVEAVDQIEAARSRKRGDPKLDPSIFAWQQAARKRLGERWNGTLARRADEESRAFKEGRRKKEPSMRSFSPVRDYEVSASIDHLTARFAGDHLKDLVAARSSLPSWNDSVAVYYPARDCNIEGKPTEATLDLPLFGKGKGKTVRFAIGVAGGSARAIWQRLVYAEKHRDEIVALETRVKKGESDEIKKLARMGLEEKRFVKLGRVGIKYNERKHKWFALISWTEHRPDAAQGHRQTAAVNFGCNVLLQAMAENGVDWSDAGFDIRETRVRFQRRRKSIQRSLRQFGSGSRGRGVKRRVLPLTKLSDRESRWVEQRIRRSAADLISWCLKHGVGRLLLLEQKGLRENFEKKTGEDAAPEVKRFIHQWPFYQHAEAVKREGAERGVVVEEIKVDKPSCTCPECNYVAAENVVAVDYASGELRVVDDMLYRRIERSTAFLCKMCGTKGKGDIVTCANMLRSVDAENPLRKMQERARKRVRGQIEQRNSDVSERKE
jgi:hypothetical protein